MVRIFSQEEMEVKYDVLPDALQDALFDDEIAAKMYEIGKKYSLSKENGKIASAETGNIVLGLTKPQEFPARIAERVGLKPAIADALIKDIYLSVLKPLAGEIKKAHGFELNENAFGAPAAAGAQKPQGAEIVLERRPSAPRVEQPAPMSKPPAPIPPQPQQAPKQPVPIPQQPAVTIRTFGQPRPPAPPVAQKPPIHQAPERPLVATPSQTAEAPRPAPPPPPSPRMSVLSGSLKMPEELRPLPQAPKPPPAPQKPPAPEPQQKEPAPPARAEPLIKREEPAPQMSKPPAPPREEARNIVTPQAPPQQKVFIPRMPTPPRQETDPYREKVLEKEKEPPQKTDKVEDPRGPQEPFFVKKGELPYTNPRIPPIDLRTGSEQEHTPKEPDPYRENLE